MFYVFLNFLEREMEEFGSSWVQKLESALKFYNFFRAISVEMLNCSFVAHVDMYFLIVFIRI